jgi:hypothetical protein
MEHVKAVINRGLSLIRDATLCFYEETAVRNNVESYDFHVDKISLPLSWDHFCTTLMDLRTTLAHNRYLHWYRNGFRGKKRSHPHGSLAGTSSNANDSSNKRPAKGKRRVG